jgi:hypothetical protein
MLNSKHLSLVNKIGDKTKFTITRVHCMTLTEMKIHSHISGASPNGKQLWIANYEYQAQGEDELSLRKNDLIEVNIFLKNQ